LDKGCSKLLDRRKKAKFQCLQYLGEINGDNLNNVRHEVSQHFKNKKMEYLKDKISELGTNSKTVPGNEGETEIGHNSFWLILI
jgi:hypothetical protein